MRRTLCLILALLAGCTQGPDYVRPEVEAPPGWRIDLQSAAEIADREWWRDFGDPALDRLIEEALASNWDLRIATTRIEEFAARLDIARAPFFPQVQYGAGASRGRAAGADTASLYELTLGAAWELDLWGRIRRADEAARAELLAAEEGRRTVVLTLVSAVATAYIDLLNLDRQLEIARRTRDSRAESVRLFELKFKGGVISALEVAQVRSEYELAAVQIPVLEREIALREHALSVLLGRNPGPIPRGPGLDALQTPAVPAGLPSSLLERRPDIRAAEQALIAANARIGEARARLFPTISLTGLLGAASADLGEAANEVWSIGAEALGPIFTGGRLRGEVRVSEARQRQLLHAYRAAVQQAFREVEDALVSYRKRQEETAARRRRLEALRRYEHFARYRYDEGYVSYIEVLDAERRLFDAELAYERSRAETHAALIALFKAMGGGWIDRAEELSRR